MQKFPLRMLSHFRIAERKKEKKKLQETMTQSEGWAPLQEKGVRVLLTGLFLQDATEARVWRAVTFTLCSAKEKKRKRQRWEWSCSSLSPASPYITGRVSRLFCCVIRYFRTPGEEMDGAVDLMWRSKTQVVVEISEITDLSTGTPRSECPKLWSEGPLGVIWLWGKWLWADPLQFSCQRNVITVSGCDSQVSVSALSYTYYSWKAHIYNIIFKHSEVHCGGNMWESLSGWG